MRRPFPSRFASRGLRGAVAGGSEGATEAGMRMFLAGGNAVDAGIATMLAASVVEFSHFGLGGEAPILVRTKEGKVFAIAGVGTMPKLGTADFYRQHKLTPLEIDDPPAPNGLKDWVPVVGILSTLVPGMVDAAIVTQREFGTKSFAEVLQPAIELADGFPIDEFRAISLAEQREVSLRLAQFAARLPAQRQRCCQSRQHLPPAGPGPHACATWRTWKRRPWPPEPRAPRPWTRCAIISTAAISPAASANSRSRTADCCATKTWRPSTWSRKKRSPPPSTATPFTSRVSGARARR